MQQTSIDKPNNRNADPLRQHLEGFRNTYNYLSRQIHLGSLATDGSLNDEAAEGSRSKLAGAARRHAAELQDNDPRKIYAGILGTLPAYVHALETLPDRREEHYDPHSISKEEHDRDVESTIAFNDVIRSSVENHPNIAPDVLVKLVASGLNRYRYTDEEKTFVLERTRGAFKGIKHEVGFKSLTYYLPDDFTPLDTTDQDDARGADFKIRCPNGVVVSIDIKATERLEQEARERKEMHFAKKGIKPPSDRIILYSGFKDEDFEAGSAWIPSQEAILRQLPKVVDELLKASGDEARLREKTLANQ